jgi:hypothetical protein
VVSFIIISKQSADVIFNIVGNIIRDRHLAILQRHSVNGLERSCSSESLSINSNDTSISRSTQLESAIPPSKIASLSSGEFVGAVADDPTNKIALKTFHCEILNDHDAITAEEAVYVPIPKVRGHYLSGN